MKPLIFRLRIIGIIAFAAWFVCNIMGWQAASQDTLSVAVLCFVTIFIIMIYRFLREHYLVKDEGTDVE